MLAVLLALRLAAPLAAELAIGPVVSSLLRARISVGDVDLDFQEGVVALKRVRLVTLDGQELVSAARMLLDADYAALLGGTFEAERVGIESPRFHVAVGPDGRLNWSDLDPDPETVGSVFRTRVARFELGAGELALRDASEDGLPPIDLAIGGITLEGAEVGRLEPGGPLSFGLVRADASGWTLALVSDEVSTDDASADVSASAGQPGPDGRIPFELELSRPDGVRMALDGRLRPLPFEIQARAVMAGLRLDRTLRLLAIPGLDVTAGRADAELELRFTLEDVDDRGLSVHGRASCRDLELAHESGRPARLRVARVEAELDALRLPLPLQPAELPEPLAIELRRVRVESPSAQLASASGAEPAPVATGPAGDGPFAEVGVRRFQLRNGRLRWGDPELPELAQIGLEVRGARWPAATAEYLELTVGSLGLEPARIAGSWRERTADLEILTFGVPLPPWNPLVSRYADFRFTRGDLSLRSDFRLRGTAFTSPARITLHDPRVEGRAAGFEATFGMPLSVAIPMLADTAGNVRIDVPVRGDLSGDLVLDVQQAVAVALQESVENGLQSAAASPLDASDSALRRVDEVFRRGIGEAAFDAGGSELEVDARLAVDAALSILGPRSRVALVPQVVSDDLLALGDPRHDEGAFGDAKRVARTIFGTSRQLGSDEGRPVESLARARVAAVQRYLVTRKGLAEERVVPVPWDGRVHEGLPRVLLRVRDAEPAPE